MQHCLHGWQPPWWTRVLTLGDAKQLFPWLPQKHRCPVHHQGLSAGNHISWRSEVDSLKVRGDFKPILLTRSIVKFPKCWPNNLGVTTFHGAEIRKLEISFVFPLLGNVHSPFCYNIKVESGKLAINPDRNLDSSFFVSQKLMENTKFSSNIYQCV